MTTADTVDTETLTAIGSDADDARRIPGNHGATPHAYDLGLFVLRLFLGGTIASHGAQKLFGWFGGGGLKGTAAFFDQAGYPHSHVFAIVAGLTEGLGGLGLAFGLLTPLAGAAVLGTMVNAIAVDWHGISSKGFFAPSGIEYPLLIAAGAAALTLTGPGRYAIDHGLPVLRRHRAWFGVVAVIIGGGVAAATLKLRG
jgi:putative oxidoreductase